MSYSLSTLWYERQRYLPGVLAVAFSALLIALQCGLLMGLFSITSIPIDHTHADIWMGAPRVLSVDLGEPIPEGNFARLENQPEVQRTEFFLQGFGYWSKPGGGRELCMIIGSNLGDHALGRVDELTPTCAPSCRNPAPSSWTLRTWRAWASRASATRPRSPAPRGRGRCAWSA